MPKIWTDASQNVLIEDEKRLDSSNFPLSVLQHKIQIFEFGMDRVVDQIVIAVIFVLRFESVLPMWAGAQLMG